MSQNPEATRSYSIDITGKPPQMGRWTVRSMVNGKLALLYYKREPNLVKDLLILMPMATTYSKSWTWMRSWKCVQTTQPVLSVAGRSLGRATVPNHRRCGHREQ